MVWTTANGIYPKKFVFKLLMANKEKYKRIGETPLFNFEENDYVYRYILKISKYSVF